MDNSPKDITILIILCFCELLKVMIFVFSVLYSMFVVVIRSPSFMLETSVLIYVSTEW
jgi:hypothetical protein